MENQMRAVHVAAFGNPDVLQVDTISVPKPAAGEVLLKVLACGINPLEGWFRSGHLSARFDRPMPYTPGTDIVGTVVEGATADGLAAGIIALGVISAVAEALSRGLDISAVVRSGREDEARALGIANILGSDGNAGAPAGLFDTLIDTVIDTVGPTLVEQRQSSLTPDAVVLTIVPLAPAKLSREGIRTVPYAFQRSADELGRVLQLLRQGRVSPPAIETIGLDGTGIAHERLLAKGNASKFVLVPECVAV